MSRLIETIRREIRSVCSDGNADEMVVARRILAAIPDDPEALAGMVERAAIALMVSDQGDDIEFYRRWALPALRAALTEGGAND